MEAAPKSLDTLTRTERQVAELMVLGKTDTEIGMILGRSPRTARFHVENAKKKLGFATRIQYGIWFDRLTRPKE